MGFLTFRKQQPVSNEAANQAAAAGLKISILCPTRGRPHSVIRLLESIRDTANVNPEIVFYKDEDDASVFPMPPDGWKPHEIQVVSGQRKTLSACWNDCYKVATGDIIMFCGDDVVFRTPGWDSAVINCFASHPDKIIFLHGDDGYWGKVFGTHGFLHRKWIDAVGYVLPPYFSSDFGDKWINDVANELHRRVYLPILTEHLHPLWGKAEWDQTHKERLQRHATDNVENIYANSAPERSADVEKLRKATGCALVSVLIPSRKRPEGLNRSIRSLLQTSTGNMEIIVRLDDDDQIPELPPGITVLSGPRHGYRNLHRYYNEMAKQAKGEWLMLWNDDAEMQEKGWDRHIASRPGEMAVINIAGEFNIFPIVHRSLYGLLGHLSQQAHSDTWLQSIARENDIEWYMPMKFKHDGAKEGAPYAETRPEYFSDTFQELLRADSAKVAEALKGVPVG